MSRVWSVPVTFLGFVRVNLRQATDLVTWYYQDVQPHYPGMIAAGEGSVFALLRVFIQPLQSSSRAIHGYIPVCGIFLSKLLVNQVVVARSRLL